MSSHLSNVDPQELSDHDLLIRLDEKMDMIAEVSKNLKKRTRILEIVVSLMAGSGGLVGTLAGTGVIF